MINEQHRAVLNSLQEKRHVRPLAMSIFYEQPKLKSKVYYLFQDSKQYHWRPHNCDWWRVFFNVPNNFSVESLKEMVKNFVQLTLYKTLPLQKALDNSKYIAICNWLEFAIVIWFFSLYSNCFVAGLSNLLR